MLDCLEREDVSCRVCLKHPHAPSREGKGILILVLIHKNTECHTADTQKIVYWSKCASLLGLELSLERYYSQFFIPTGQRKVYKDTKRIPVENQSASQVRMWPTACHATMFLSASLLKDCVLLLPFFVFKWTLNDFDVSVETLAIRESTLASIPCQGLTLNWRAAVNKLSHETDFFSKLSGACS